MALDEHGNPIPGTVDAIGGFQWPPPEWGYTVGPSPLEQLETTLGPRGTGSTIDPVPPPPPPPPPAPAPGTGRKGGSTSGPDRSGTEQLGPALSQGGEEVPLGALPPPPSAELAAPPLPPPAPDAISGPGALPPMPSDAQPQMPPSYLTDDESAVAKAYGATPDQVANLSDEQLGRAESGLSDQDQAVLDQKRATAKANFIASRMLEESQRTLEQQQQNAAAYQQAQVRAQQQTDQIMLESDRLASTPTDRNRWANRSAPTAIAGLLGAIVGGLMQPYTGGRNSGLDALLGMVDKDVDDQKFDAEQKRQGLTTRGNLVAEQLQRSGNVYQAAETVRLSHYQTVINGLQAEAQKFDPHGTAASDIAHAIRGVEVRKAQAAQALFQQNLKDEAERAKIGLDVANAAKARAETAKITGQAGAAKPVVDFGAQYGSLNEIPEKLHDRAYRLPSGKYAIANSTTSAQEATTFVKQYKQLDYDLNALQSLSTQRNGAKSIGGTFSEKWSTDDEQHYKQLLTDAVNHYGLMIHGRSPTSQVLEHVLESFPDLKAAYERGDTTYLLGKMRDDVDNRGTLELGSYGADEKLRTPRPKPAEVNVNTLSTPLLEKPVKGDAGFARFDVANGNQQLNAIEQQYMDNPRLGEGESYQKFLGRIEDTQRANADAIRGEVASLGKKAKRTPEEDARLANDAQALADREEFIKAIADAKARDVDAERAKATAAANRKKDALERPSAQIPAHFEKP